MVRYVLDRFLSIREHAGTCPFSTETTDIRHPADGPKRSVTDREQRVENNVSRKKVRMTFNDFAHWPLLMPGDLSEPLGQRTDAICWLQKRVAERARRLPRDFGSLAEWEAFRSRLRADLPGVIGIPEFPPLGESLVRGRIRVGQAVFCERVDVYVDADYAIPTFVFLPERSAGAKLPALVWNPGWPEDKWKPAYQEFAVRMARQGYVVLIP